MADKKRTFTMEHRGKENSQGHALGVPSIVGRTPHPTGDGRKFQVISSLFSYNPDMSSTAATADGGKDSEYKEAFASNQPVEGSSFVNLGLHPVLSTHVATKLKILEPTLIQTKSLNSAKELRSSYRDVIIQSETGSGKTLAYLLPIVNNILFPTQSNTAKQIQHSALSRELGPLALILAPTRELAVQIQLVLESLLNIVPSAIATVNTTLAKDQKSALHWAVSGTIIGGEKRKSEKARIRKGINIIVSTPGRLLDHLRTTETLSLEHVKWLVLDEADRLLDLGFEENLKAIFRFLDGKEQRLDKVNRRTQHAPTVLLPKSWPTTRQTILCSATMKSRLAKLIEWELHNPILISTEPGTSLALPHLLKGKLYQHQNEVEGQIDETALTTLSASDLLHTPTQLTHTYLLTPLKLRLVSLLSYVLSVTNPPSKLLVFFSTRAAVDFYYALFSQKFTSIQFSKLHGSLPVIERNSAISTFSRASAGVMFSTDVAARGLDLDVTTIVQYDPPVDAAEYVHRVGRTARCGKSGSAVLFISPGEEGFIEVIKSKGVILRAVTVEQRGAIALAFQTRDPTFKSTGSVQTWEDALTTYQLAFEQWIHTSEQNLNLAREAFASFVKGYATYPSNIKHIFHVKKLHLGHLAKSFALRETPSLVSLQSKKQKAMEVTLKNKLAVQSGSDRVEQENNKEGNANEQAERVRKIKRGAQSKDIQSYAIVNRKRQQENLVNEFHIGSGSYGAKRQRKVKPI